MTKSAFSRFVLALSVAVAFGILVSVAVAGLSKEDSHMKTVRGQLKTGELIEQFELTFEDAEFNALKLYAEDVEKCLRRSFLRSGENFHLSLKFKGLDTSNP